MIVTPWKGVPNDKDRTGWALGSETEGRAFSPPLTLEQLEQNSARAAGSWPSGRHAHLARGYYPFFTTCIATGESPAQGHSVACALWWGPQSAPGLIRQTGAKEGLESSSDMGLTVTKGSLLCQGEKAIPAPKAHRYVYFHT